MMNEFLSAFLDDRLHRGRCYPFPQTELRQFSHNIIIMNIITLKRSVYSFKEF